MHLQTDNKINVIHKLKFEYGGKHCGKRRKCWLPAFSPFPTKFSKAFSFKAVKSWDCVVKGNSLTHNHDFK